MRRRGKESNAGGRQGLRAEEQETIEICTDEKKAKNVNMRAKRLADVAAESDSLSLDKLTNSLVTAFFLALGVKLITLVYNTLQTYGYI
jgi:hypothetical protein